MLVGAAVVAVGACGVESTAAPLAVGEISVPGLDTVQSGTLTVGIDLAHPPLAFRDGAGNPTGVAVDIAQAMAQRLGLRASFVGLPPTQLLDAVATRRVDVAIGPISVADASSAFHVLAWLRGGADIVTRSDAVAQPSSVMQLCGLRIAVEAGTFAARELSEAVAPQCGGVGVVSSLLGTDVEAAQAVASGTVDAQLTDPATATYEARMDGNLRAASEIARGPDLGMAVDASSPTIREAIDRSFAAVRADGTYDLILTSTWKLYDSAV